MKRQSKIFITIIVAAVVMLLILASTPAAMAGPQRIRRGAEGQSQIVLPVDQVTIEKKTLSEVITNTGREYALSTGTIIVGLDGQQVSIRKMLVPCDAEVTYNNKGNAREAARIQIKRVHSDASWQWTSKKAE
jgi:hypothetical protein